MGFEALGVDRACVGEDDRRARFAASPAPGTSTSTRRAPADSSTRAASRTAAPTAPSAPSKK
jgi:hypothetical protein